MIVVDNDVVSYFWLEAGRTEAARSAGQRDPDWRAPRPWPSEFRNVLSLHVAHRELLLVDAQRIAETVETDMDGVRYTVSSADVLRLADQTEHPAYDCEYVALPQELNVSLVTGHWTVADCFPAALSYWRTLRTNERRRNRLMLQPTVTANVPHRRRHDPRRHRCSPSPLRLQG